jgi:hypothetical protein
MRNLKLTSLMVIGLFTMSLNMMPLAVADTVRSGGPCQNGDRDRIQEGYSFRCVKASRSITNLNGKKLIWKQLPGRKLEWTTSSRSRIEVLNSLNLGYWKQIDQSKLSGFDGEAFISSWPCIIYMGNSSEAEHYIWDWKVNGEMYGGTWVPTDSQYWVVNEPNYGPAKCVTYFSLHYGGQRITQ